MPIKADWYLDFFKGLVVDLWEQAVSVEQTRLEVDFALGELRVQPGARLLDVPCGLGRHAIELADRGFRVTGVDVSADCLVRGRKSAASRNVAVDWVQSEMREFPMGEPFDGAICLGNSLGYFDRDGTEAFLHRLAQSLRPEADFILETAAVAESMLPNLKPQSEFTFGDLTVVDAHDYDPLHSCMQSTMSLTRDGQTTIHTDWQFVFTLAELNRMLTAAGFQVRHLYSTLDKEPYRLGSPNLYLVAIRS